MEKFRQIFFIEVVAAVIPDYFASSFCHEVTQTTFVVDGSHLLQVVIGPHDGVGVYLDNGGIFPDGGDSLILGILPCLNTVANPLGHLNVDRCCVFKLQVELFKQFEYAWSRQLCFGENAVTQWEAYEDDDSGMNVDNRFYNFFRYMAIVYQV